LRAFIDQHRHTHGVEPICKVLQIAPSGYRRYRAQQRDATRLGQRAKRDAQLRPQIERVWQANLRVYGADKVWMQLRREGTVVARCTVERLMRGKVVRTTVSDRKAACPLDRVNRQFKAERPNQLWVSDFTYVSTWQGWQYVAFVIDVYARRIVGWRVSSSMRTDFVLDALEQALYARQPERDGTRTGGRNTSASATARDWPRPASPHLWAARVTATTTPWPRRSMACTRPS